MGNTNWRTEPTNVEKLADDLWLGAQLVKAAQAGFDEKNDALVTVEPIASGIEIELTSKVMRQYGDQIKSVILNTVKEAGFDGVKVTVQDKNAWDYTIKARVLGALERGSKA